MKAAAPPNIIESAIKSSFIKFLAFFAVSIAVSPFSLAQGNYANPLDARLKRGLEASNAKFPAMVAPNLRQEKATVFNGVLTNIYTVTNRTSAQLASMNVSATQRAGIFPAICADPVMKRLMRDGVTFKYVYLGSDAKVAGQVVIMPQDCQGH